VELPGTIRARLEEIRRDKLSGATALGRRAAELLVAWAKEHRNLPVEAFRRRVREICRELIWAQPAMASIVNLANRVLWSLDQALAADAPEAVAQVAGEFLRRLQRTPASYWHGRPVELPPEPIVLTYSYSQAVVEFLQLIRPRAVLCTEGRPAGEGLMLAREVARSGIRVTVAIDAAVFQLMPRATFAIVGADAVSETFVMNKIGTCLVALAAQHHGKPLYCVCGSEKFLPAGYRLPPEPRRDPAEILPAAIPGIEVENFYFEPVPCEWFTGWWTEEGLLGIEQIRARVRAQPLHPFLMAANGAG